MTSLTLTQARRLAIDSQLLGPNSGSEPRRAEAGQTVLSIIRRLGYLQIDTIAVVERAHHHTLWSRWSRYSPGDLHALHAERRRLYEYWIHGVAAYLPMDEYRYSIPAMKRYTDRPHRREWLSQNRKLVGEVKARIRREGPLASADFAAPKGKSRRGWWDWKPAKRALDMLFSMGELMVRERRNFQRVYDLTERVLPEHVDTTPPKEDEAALFAIRKAVAANGVLTLRDKRLNTRRSPHLTEALNFLVRNEELTPVEIEGRPGRSYYARTRGLENLDIQARRTYILSPFDNLVIMRERIKDLFGFDYSLECYLPAAKRRFGYFSLPVLRGERFIARLDAKAIRNERLLSVPMLWFETSVDGLEIVCRALAGKLRKFAAFNGCRDVSIGSSEPRRARDLLERELEKQAGVSA
jgi:uncharacterized protein YcaQ